VSTYQAVTGSGSKAVSQMVKERKSEQVKEPAYPHQIDMNCLPHCDDFIDNGYTKEELKMINETRKILGIDDLPVTATAVRVPVTAGHSESVNLELKKAYKLEDVKEAIKDFAGLKLLDQPSKNKYPMPIDAKNKDEVYVGRIRKDYSLDNALNFWVVTDNLRKGAATNAVQILNHLRDHKFVK
jgi:aspartate-semialdehyde dehydrogenase